MARIYTTHMQAVFETVTEGGEEYRFPIWITVEVSKEDLPRLYRAEIYVEGCGEVEERGVLIDAEESGWPAQIVEEAADAYDALGGFVPIGLSRAWDAKVREIRERMGKTAVGILEAVELEEDE